MWLAAVGAMHVTCRYLSNLSRHDLTCIFALLRSPGSIPSSLFCPLQESAHSSLRKQTGVSWIDVSSHSGITQRGTLLVIAEAVLAAVVQAEAGAAPMNRKKAAAEVITGVSDSGLPSTALLLDA
jgi:hypothetical protein